MKLRNRKTGIVIDVKIRDVFYDNIAKFKLINKATGSIIAMYNSLAELNEEWKDYKETALDEMIEKLKSDFEKYPDEWNNLEDAKKIVKRLEAFTKLKKEKGFRFTGWAMLDSDMIAIYAKRKFESIKSDEDLDLLFGGEE